MLGGTGIPNDYTHAGHFRPTRALLAPTHPLRVLYKSFTPVSSTFVLRLGFMFGGFRAIPHGSHTTTGENLSLVAMLFATIGLGFTGLGVGGLGLGVKGWGFRV